MIRSVTCNGDDERKTPTTYPRQFTIGERKQDQQHEENGESMSKYHD
jgi:hypothetical protein